MFTEGRKGGEHQTTTLIYDSRIRKQRGTPQGNATVQHDASRTPRRTKKNIHMMKKVNIETEKEIPSFVYYDSRVTTKLRAP